MIKIRNSKTVQHAKEHYDGASFYIGEVLKTYTIVFEMLSGKNRVANKQKHLSDEVNLNGHTINDLWSSLSFGVKGAVKKKVKEKGFQKFISSKKSVNSLYLDKAAEFVDVFAFLTANLEKIITGSPASIVLIETSFKAKFSFLVDANGGFKKPFGKLLEESIFSYSKFSEKKGGLPLAKKSSPKWNRFLFAKMLGVRTCAYCNLNATFTVTDEKGVGVTAPSIDHFFDKSTRPLFALSFYNLIPSCSICNSTLKNRKVFSLENYIHPYIGGFSDAAKFTYKPQDTKSAYGAGENILVEFLIDPTHPTAAQIKNSIDCFGLEMIYSKYADVIQELILKKLAYNSKYLEIIKENTYDGLNLTHEEAYRLAFGNYYHEEDFQKRPLAKMTKDIVEELGLI